MAELISAGLLREGERLYASLAGRWHPEPKHFAAELGTGATVRIVSDGGDGSLNGEQFASPSTALAALFGRQDSSWKNWKVERNGQLVLLESIRDEFDNSSEQ